MRALTLWVGRQYSVRSFSLPPKNDIFFGGPACLGVDPPLLLPPLELGALLGLANVAVALAALGDRLASAGRRPDGVLTLDLAGAGVQLGDHDAPNRRIALPVEERICCH